MLFNCLTILRHWVQSKETSIEERIKQQNALDNIGAMKSVIPLLYTGREKITSEALKLCEILIRGGNKKVQKSLYNEFTNSTEEGFFNFIRQRFTKAIEDLKAQRALFNKSKRSMEKDNNQTDDINNNNNDNNNNNNNEESSNNNVNDSIEMNEEDENKTKNIIYKDPGLIVDTLKLLQAMCQNGQRKLQDYLREQTDNTKSLDLIEETTQFGVQLMRFIFDPSLPEYKGNELFANVHIATQFFDTLSEFCKGCPANMISVTTAKALTIAQQLFHKFHLHVDENSMLLKNSILSFFHTLVEGSYPLDKDSKEEKSSSAVDVAINSLPLMLLGVLSLKVLDDSVRVSSEYLGVNNNPKDKKKNSNITQPLGIPQMQLSMFISKKVDILPLLHKEFVDNCMVLLNYLSLFDTSNNLNDLIEHFNLSYVKSDVQSIEILNNNKLKRIVFPVPEECKHLDKKTKDLFDQDVKRATPVDKVTDFLLHYPIFEKQIQHRNNINKSIFSWIVHDRPWKWSNLLLILTIIINIIIIISTEESNIDSSIAPLPTNINILLRICAIIHSILSALQFISFFWGQAIVIIMNGILDRKRFIKSDATQSFQLNWLYYLFGNFLSVWTTLYLISSIIGIFFYPIYCIHLLDIVARSPILKNVLRAVTEHASSLLLTALLAIVIVYMYSIISFYGFRDSYNVDGLECSTIFKCWVSNLNYGLRSGGGIGDVLVTIDPDTPDFGWRVLFDLTFFIIIIVIFINLIFGIIIDTFSELRNDRDAIIKDMSTYCFVCNIDKDTFQRVGTTLKEHQKKDHNIWNYLAFLIYASKKQQLGEPLSYLELFVLKQVSTNNTSFFPLEHSIVTENLTEENE